MLNHSGLPLGRSLTKKPTIFLGPHLISTNVCCVNLKPQNDDLHFPRASVVVMTVASLVCVVAAAMTYLCGM